jgi:hypothetical protein
MVRLSRARQGICRRLVGGSSSSLESIVNHALQQLPMFVAWPQPPDLAHHEVNLLSCWLRRLWCNEMRVSLLLLCVLRVTWSKKGSLRAPASPKCVYGI